MGIFLPWERDGADEVRAIMLQATALLATTAMVVRGDHETLAETARALSRRASLAVQYQDGRADGVAYIAASHLHPSAHIVVWGDAHLYHLGVVGRLLLRSRIHYLLQNLTRSVRPTEIEIVLERRRWGGMRIAAEVKSVALLSSEHLSIRHATTS